MITLKYQSSNGELLDDNDNGGDDDIVGNDTGDVNLLGDNKLTDLLKAGMGGSLGLKGKPKRFWLKIDSCQSKHVVIPHKKIARSGLICCHLTMSKGSKATCTAGSQGPQ